MNITVLGWKSAGLRTAASACPAANPGFVCSCWRERIHSCTRFETRSSSSVQGAPRGRVATLLKWKSLRRLGQGGLDPSEIGAKRNFRKPSCSLCLGAFLESGRDTFSYNCEFPSPAQVKRGSSCEVYNVAADCGPKRGILQSAPSCLGGSGSGMLYYYVCCFPPLLSASTSTKCGGLFLPSCRKGSLPKHLRDSSASESPHLEPCSHVSAHSECKLEAMEDEARQLKTQLGCRGRGRGKGSARGR